MLGVSPSHKKDCVKSQKKRRILFRRFKFFSYEINNNKSIDGHFTALSNLASACEFGDQSESLIIAKIIAEYNDTDIKEKLQEELTLEQVLELIRAKENNTISSLTKPSGSKLCDAAIQQFEKLGGMENASDYLTRQKKITKEMVDSYINSYLKDCLSLNIVEALLEAVLNNTLSQDDKHYIKSKYLERLVELWLNEVSENVMNMFDNNSPLQFIDELSRIKSLQGCLTLGLNTPYNNLLKDFCKNAVSSKSQEEKYIQKFKSTTLTFMRLKTAYLRGEMNFLQSLVRSMKISKNIKQFCSSLKASDFVESVEDETISFQKFLHYIINCSIVKDQIIQLKASAKVIVEQERYFFVKCVKDTIEGFLKPFVLTESSDDGRKLLEVTGEHILMSEVLPEIKKRSTFLEIEEVRFARARVFHINEDLNPTLWHGKNIVVTAETVIVSKDKNIIWNVSGKDAEDDNIDQAGTDSEGFGFDGAKGNPGESGGNVLLICDEIENAINLKIVSNGGNGSKGQDGGNGKDGQDGNYIAKNDFLELFPPVSTWYNLNKQENLKKTRSSIMENIQSVKFYTLGNLTSLSTDEFNLIFKKYTQSLEEIYCEVRTQSGCQIVFSFYYGKWFEWCQSFLLHKGSDGESGKAGGKGGPGGKGGFAGNIEILIAQNSDGIREGISVCAANGEDGKHGKWGEFGKPGKSGQDCAYMDWTLTQTKYFLPHSLDCHRLTVKYHQARVSDSTLVYCSHNLRYAEITKVKQDFNQSYRMMNISKHNLKEESQFEVQVLRKKTINIKSILDHYGSKTSMVDCQKLNDYEKKLKQIYKDISNEEDLHEKSVKECNITRKIEFFNNDQYKVDLKLISLNNTSHQNSPCDFFYKDQLIELAKNSPSDDSVWKSLSQIQLSLQELNILWNTINIQSLPLLRDDLIKEVQFSSKYHLAVLGHLGQSPFEQQSSNSCDMMSSKRADSVESCLILCSDQESFSRVESYLCDDSPEKTLSIVKDFERSKCKELCWEVFSLYLHDGKNVLSEETFVSCQEHLDLFKLEKAKLMLTKLLYLLNGLKGASSQQMYDTLVKAVAEDNINLKIDVDCNIRNDKLLQKLYDKYIEAVFGPLVQKSFKFTRNLTSQLKKRIIDDMKCKGALSVFYREVLARNFETNIQLYTLNDSNQMVLAYDHNPSADEAVRMLIKDNRFLKLKVDEGLCKMNRLHIEKGQMYNQILIHLDSIIDKDQFDNFLSDSPFLKSGYKGVSKSIKIGLQINHMLMEDENIQLISNSFELDEDKYLISSRLAMLKHEYVGYQSILHNIGLHMKAEGNHLTVAELCCVINFILKSLLESPQTIHLVSWIIATNHQTNWLTELTLLKLELCFKQPLDQGLKFSWRKYLNDTNKDTLLLFVEKLGNDQTLDSLESVEELLFLLSHIPNYHDSLSQLYLAEWKYLLKDVFWICQVKSIGCWSEEQLRSASFYLVTLENSVGTNLCSRFVELVKSHLKQEETEDRKMVVLNTLGHLTSKETMFSENLLEHLSNADINKWGDVIEKQSNASKGVRSLKQLNQLIKNSSNTSENMRTGIDETVNCVEKIGFLSTFLNSKLKDEMALKAWINSLYNTFNGSKIPLFSEEKTCETKFNVQDQMFRNLLKEMEEESANHNQTLEVKAQSESNFLCSNLIEIFLATICTSIYLKFEQINLRDTQLLAILTFLKASGNVLGQVSTGEGKSFVIISVAILKALSGYKVDIITSSKVLAKRDARDYKDICKLFGIEVGHNCSENIEERKTTYSNCQIVYGELAYYQRDYLLDRVYNNNVLGDRTYEAVLIDEVDSMLLDKGNNVLYLSHEIPGLDKLEPLMVFIWKYLNLPYSQKNPEEWFSVAQLRDTILYEMYGQIKLEDIRNLDTSVEEKHVQQTWAHLQKEEVIDSTGKILQVDEAKLGEVARTCIHGGHIKYLFNKIINREKAFEIPNHLKQFVEDHLEEWIESAINAMHLEMNVDYVVDVDRSVDSADRNANIIIVDRDTGTDLTNSQWDQGIHQFLQLKHGCRLSPLTFKAVFISNVSYLKLYKTLLGLTGTLGSMSDRDLLKEVYKVEFVTIPTATAKDFTEKVPIYCNSTDEWSSKIFEEVYNITNTRSALIICESVSDVLFLKKSFNLSLKNKLSTRQVYTYTRDYEKFTVAENLDPRHIVISTNLAGRGTDIKLSQNLVKAGGLHVCLSFLPSNCRIEEQAFGRAARNGQPGSGQIIFRNLGQISALKIIDMKKERDISEVFRVSDVRKYYETKIKLEEEWFFDFQKTYTALKNSNHSTEIKSVLLMACLDQWAIWLERNTNSGVSSSICSLIDSVSKLIDDDFYTWSNQIQDPFQLTKLGLIYLKQKDFPKAIQMFSQVIRKEPVFSEAAYYYRVCAMSSKKDMESTDLIRELKIVGKKLEERIESSIVSAESIDWLKSHNTRAILQIESFKEQQQTIILTHKIFIESIQNIVGQYITPESFLSIGSKPKHQISEEKVSSMIFKDLINHQIIKHKVKDNISEKELYFLSEYGMCPRKVKKTLESCKVTGLELEEYILKCVRSDLPSREMFWNELVSAGILTNEIKYVFVNHRSLNEVDPSLAKQIKKFADDINIACKDRLSLYLLEELFGQQEESFDQSYVIILEDVLEEKLGSKKFEFLKQENLTKPNKLATISNLVDAVEFDYFDYITQKDFLKVGIPTESCNDIITDLLNQQIISAKEKGNVLQYSLTINCEDIDSVELETHGCYTDDVRKLLSHCFAFRIALQKFKHVLPLCKGNFSSLCFPLQINLEKRLWHELITHGIIERIPNLEKIKSKQLQNLYSASMKKDGYAKVFSKLYDKDKCTAIVDELIKNKLLKSTFLCDYKINLESMEKDTLMLTDVPPTLENEIETIKLILSNHLYLSRNVEAIEGELKRLAGNIHNVETPSLPLTPLEAVLNECGIPTSEVTIFSLNGFDQVIRLEEKKYTQKMKKNTLFTALFGVAQIAVGAFLEFCTLGSPFGLGFILQGINDLLFVTSCAFTGYFSWKSYVFSKLTSIIIHSSKCLKSFFRIGNSNFASKTAGISFQSLKEKCCNIFSNVESTATSNFARKSAGISLYTVKEKCSSLFSNIKSAVGSLFGSEVAKPVSETKIITNLCKRVVVHVAGSVASGATFTVIDHVVQSKLENLEEVLAELIYSDVDTTVIKHPLFESAVELCDKLGKNTAEKIVEDSILKVVDGYQDQLDKCFDSFDICMIKTLIERTTSKGFSKSSHDTPLTQITNTVINVCTVIKSAWPHILVISTLVSEILNEIHQELQSEIIKLRELPKSSIVPYSKLDDFKQGILNKCQSKIKRVMSEHISNKILSPVMKCAESCFMKNSFLKLGKIRKPFTTDEEISKFTQSKGHHFQKRKKAKSGKKKTDLFSCDFIRISCRLLETTKNLSVMAYLVLHNAPMDLYSLELCFTIINLAFKQEGITFLSLRVKVEGSETKCIFDIGEKGNQAPMVSIYPDPEFSSDLLNTFFVKDVFQFLSKSFLEYYPEHKGLTASVLKEMVFRVIDHHCDSSSADGNDWVLKDTSSCKSSQINSECEQNTPYQHSHYYDGGWKFNPSADFDLRENKPINLNHVQCHIVKGFETALKKINNHIHMIQDRLRSFNLILNDFTATRHQLAPPPLDDSPGTFHCYTIQYELVVPVMLKGYNRLVDFTIVLRLANENPKNKPQPNSPNGPHILYEINPINNVKFLSKGLKGHILLNIVCLNTSYGLKDCHVAGELIIVSGLKPKPLVQSETPVTDDLMLNCETGNLVQKKEMEGNVSLSERGNEEVQEGAPKESRAMCVIGQEGTLKSCDFVIIGDSLVKGIHKHTTLPNCDFEIFPDLKIKQLRWKIISLLKSYQGIKCVVFFLGNDIVKTSVAKEKLVSCIFEVIEEVKKLAENVKVVVYSLTYVKKPAKKHFGKIFETNKMLNDYCKTNHFVLADTNLIINRQDLVTDGIHLSQAGYQKLGKHLSEKCRELVNIP